MDEEVRATRQKIPLRPQASKADPRRQMLADYFAEKLARFGRLHEHDPVADFFQLDSPHCQLTPDTHPEISALINHPCRGCPHLTLAYTAGANKKEAALPPEPAPPKYSNADSQDLTPVQKVGSAMPKPLCTAYPQCHRDTVTGRVSVSYKETWYRCPLYGISYINSVVQNLQRQINDLRADLRNNQ